MNGPTTTELSAQIAPPSSRDPLWHAPLLILAPSRSHTTVFSAMLGCHPELYAFPELLLFRAPTVGHLLTQLPNRLPVKTSTAGLARAVAQLRHQSQSADAIADARDWLQARRDWRPEHVFDVLLTAAAPKLGIEKSPENSSRQEFFERLTDAYPRARYLHLTRHPVPTARSMHAAWAEHGLWTVTPDLFHQFSLGHWLFQHQRIADFMATLPPDRGLTVRSEDVLAADPGGLTGVCRWLGIDAQPATVEQMTHPENWVYAHVGPDTALGGGDGGFLERPALRHTEPPGPVAIPPEWTVDPWLALRVHQLAARLGY